jgi:hypothetical protein
MCYTPDMRERILQVIVALLSPLPLVLIETPGEPLPASAYALVSAICVTAFVRWRIKGSRIIGFSFRVRD